MSSPSQSARVSIAASNRRAPFDPRALAGRRKDGTPTAWIVLPGRIFGTIDPLQRGSTELQTAWLASALSDRNRPYLANYCQVMQFIPRSLGQVTPG